MRLENRVEKLEAQVPPTPLPKHVILAIEGEEEKALDEYGRDKIKEGEGIFWILLTELKPTEFDPYRAITGLDYVKCRG